MNEPYLAVFVEHATLHIAKKLPTEEEPRTILDVDIDEVTSDEFDDASRKLGTTLLGILSLWHKDLFLGWGVPSEEAATQFGHFELAMELVSKSLFRKTSEYTDSIELILRQAAVSSDAVQQFMDEVWPSLRRQLSSYPP